MTQGDIAILEFLHQKDIAATPAVVAYNIDFSAGYVRRRMRRLLEEDLLTQVDENQGMYRVSEKGEAYLAGELDRDDLEVE